MLSYKRSKLLREYRTKPLQVTDQIKFEHPRYHSIWIALRMIFKVVKSKLFYLYFLYFFSFINLNYSSTTQAIESPNLSKQSNISILSDENFTFTHNGSFLQLDAGREWPFNSKREISFKFKTKSPHGLLVYQTFDHSKLIREDDQEGLEQTSLTIPSINTPTKVETKELEQQILSNRAVGEVTRTTRSTQSENFKNKHFIRGGRDNLLSSNVPLDKLPSNTITATASEKLVNSLFSASPAAAINGNHNINSRSDMPISLLMTPTGSNSVKSLKDLNSSSRSHRVINNEALDTESSKKRVKYESQSSLEGDGSTILSSSTISSFSASIYELYLKLENGRLKIMYEFGSRLNQTYCGRGLNDDRWHKIDLKVDPELNQMILILDQLITVEIVLSQQPIEDENVRRNELVFTNSILYLGGLDNNAMLVKHVKQRLYLAQFIGCIGQILLKTDQHTESTLQPVPISRMVLVKRGCINKCDTDNFCLHKSTCVNLYSATRCDCFGTKYEDEYCWQDQLTTLSMFGYSTLVYRIYDWRDRHHSSINRLSMQFKTLALDSMLFFAYGDFNAQQNQRNLFAAGASSTLIQAPFIIPSSMNISNNPTILRPANYQPINTGNYLAVSLSNGSIIVEVNFGDQPIVLSNLLYDKLAAIKDQASQNNDSVVCKLTNLSDGLWHNVTFAHSNKQLFLYLDDHSITYNISGKNSLLYFDPSIYVGAVPNLILNETRYLSHPFNLRHKFVGCLKSVYFNQHNLLLALKHQSPMVEYRDLLGKPLLDKCLVQEPSSLPLTMRSGKSYLTFQLTSNPQISALSKLRLEVLDNSGSEMKQFNYNSTDMQNNTNITPVKKLSRIDFEYKTPLHSHFLAGGHLKDSSYHDLGGFWTLHAREDCQLYFTINSGLTYEPEQIIKIDATNTSCDPNSWYKISISMISGHKSLNVTRSKITTISKIEDEYSSKTSVDDSNRQSQTFMLKSSVELLHQVQIGGDLVKFGESSSVPFTGCMRRIQINGHLFDSRDFVTTSAITSHLTANLNQVNSTIVTQGQTSSSDVISSRMAQGYVTLDSCQLVNHCLSLNPCKNNGTCKINELGEPECDCSKTGYSGKRCHFSNYKQSCQDLFLSGQRKSSQYLLDLDRNGPMRPIRVRCNMNDGNPHIETVLSHNLPPEYPLRGSDTRDLMIDVTYIAFHHMYLSDGFYMHDDNDEELKNKQELMLRSLISQSLYCRQYFKYECKSAPLDLGNRTWLEATYPKTHRINSLDGANQGKCSCASSDKKCLDPSKNCNCDSGESIWTDDSTVFIGQEDVGITRIVVLSHSPESESYKVKKSFTSYLEAQSRFTLGDLKCYGTKKHESQHEITFKTSDAYIEVPGWKRGDISFSFRTASNPPAIILYQLATSRNHGYFRLTLISDTRLLFEFIVNRKPRKLHLTSMHKLNNGEWQQVFIEYDLVNLRLTVNDDSIMVDLDINDYLGTFEGPLFIGGAPSKYLVGDISKRNGFTGCFRGLSINGISVDLRSYLSPSMPTVTSSCKPSCSKNLCQNGGKCIEYWGSYECECSNPIAHSGSNCEINLNTNSITFVTQESYYVQVLNDSLLHPSYLIKNILLNIRTYQETALILYASDHLNNFIQLHKNGSSLVLTFNSNSSIIIAQVPIDDEASLNLGSLSHTTTTTTLSVETNSITINSSRIVPSSTTSNQANLKKQASIGLNFSLIDKSIKISNTSGSGQPIQIKIERHRLRTTFYVNNNFMVVEKPLIFLTNYTQNPWSNPELELVRPPRPKMGSKTYFQIFLANIDDYFSTRLPGFTGCIQGFSIDNQLFDFNRAHLTGELKGEYKIGCKMHCDSFPCKNQGTCIENWKEDRIQCKCDTTSYVGRLCDEDIAAIFNGYTSYFVYRLSKKLHSKTFHVDFSEGTKNSIESVSNSSEDSSNKKAAKISSNYLFVDEGEFINFFELSLAFSTEFSQPTNNYTNQVQVLVLLTRANSSKHFFLGVTADGSLLIQEDYGNSMSLSRLIKKSDQPYNDGHRHMIKYSRFNQTIQILVDHQTYLPTMSVITARHMSKYSKSSLIFIGTAGEQFYGPKVIEDPGLDNVYTNYSGCISNLMLKLDDIIIEPLSEAFGQDLEIININSTKLDKANSLAKADLSVVKNPSLRNQVSDKNKGLLIQPLTLDEDLTTTTQSSTPTDKPDATKSNENMEIIVARDVEQGKCSSFKKLEFVNEKRSINEPKYTPLLEPRPIYMDPPRIKTYFRKDSLKVRNKRLLHQFDWVFYSSLAALTVIFSLVFIYAYILQVRYKSKKFRHETPFFHKRNVDVNETVS